MDFDKQSRIAELYNLFVDLHIEIIEQTGGEDGFRSESSLLIGVERIIDKIFRNEDPIKIAGFCLKWFATRHCFCDGNKRSAFLFAGVLLYKHFKKQFKFRNVSVQYTKDAEKFIVDVARGAKSDKEINGFLSVLFEKTK